MSEGYELSPAVQAFLTRWPPRMLMSTAPCPDCHRRAAADLIREEVVCYRHDPEKVWPLTDYLTHTDATPRRSRLPDDLRQYYPNGVTCPDCGSRLRLRIRDEAGDCARCDQSWTFAHLIDAKAAHLMQEEPLGATIYRRPRH